MKKLISFVLCFTMILTTSSPVFAQDNFEIKKEKILLNRNTVEQLTRSSLDNDTYIKIKDEIYFLENSGINSWNLHDVEVKEDSIVYTYIMDDGIESVIEIKEDNSGDRFFNISENGKIDEIIITSDGKVFSDGIEIKVEDVEAGLVAVQDIQPMSVSYNTMNCPRGSASDYTDYYYTESVSSIVLSQKLSLYTATGLSILLSGLSGSAFLASISYAVATELLYGFGSEETYGLSYKAAIYNHKDGPYFGTTYRKYVTTWYSEKSYKGSTTKITSYRITEYD